MAVYTDDPQFATAFLSSEIAAGFVPAGPRDPALRPVLDAVFQNGPVFVSNERTPEPIPTLLITEYSPRSQYDFLIEMARGRNGLPDGIFCLAGAGEKFHGFKGRHWEALQGNLHLAVHFAPGREVERFGVAFTILAALSVAESLNQIAGLENRARIKWVNDILVEEKKVGGVLAYTQSQGTAVTSAVLGIGVNVEATPEVVPTPFVPAVGAVRDLLSGTPQGLRQAVLWELLKTLGETYRVLLEEGVDPLLRRYREHSMVLGRRVTICTEDSDEQMEVLAEGRVAGIGENLELLLEGRDKPVTGGRLVLE